MYPEEMTQAIGEARVAQQSPLLQLLDQQDKTAELLRVLGDKLSPVSDPHPVDNKERADSGYHVETALCKQREINDAVAYLIDTLVI